MHTRNLSLFFFLFLIIACQTVSKQSDTRFAEIDTILEELKGQERFNGNVLIAEKGEIIYEKSFGYADYEQEIPLTADNLFNIASVSKMMTSVCVMILEEKGQLDLEDQVVKYFPEFPYQTIRIKHLLTHTSGLPLIQRQPLKEALAGKGFNNQEVLELIAKMKPKLYFEPGTGVEYANTNFLLLALLVEQVSGMNFNDFLVQYIFQKADMTHSFLKKKRVPASHQSRIVSYYRRPLWLSHDFQSVDTLSENLDDLASYGNNYGESGIYTTVRDLLKFHDALMNGSLLKRATLKKMYAPFSLINDAEYALHTSSNYPANAGLGWKVAKDSSDGKVVFHAGGFRGGRSFFIRNISRDQCVIMLTNNEETNFHTFTFPLRALNQKTYKLDKRSLARMYADELSLNGVASATQLFYTYQDSSHIKEMLDWDFEEIGAELEATGKIEELIGHNTLYTEVFPNEYSWAMLGNAYLLAGDKKQAKASLKKALTFNPEYADAKDALNRISN